MDHLFHWQELSLIFRLKNKTEDLKMGKKSRRKKAKKSMLKIVQVGIYFFTWWIEATEDKVIDKEEQKQCLSDMLDIVGDTDIELE